MAEKQVVWAKKQIFLPGKKPAGGGRGHQKVQGQVSSPPPQPKPKPKKKAARVAAQSNLQVHVEERSKAEYAELRAVRRESVNHYAPLCPATRSKPQGGGAGSGSGQSNLPSVAEEGRASSSAGKDSTSDPEIHYSNVHIKKEARNRSNCYENYKFPEEKESNNRWKNFCLLYWKTIVTVGGTAAVLLVALVVVLGIAAAGLSGSSSNGARYEDLQEAALEMADTIQRLQRQLNDSNAAILQLKSDSNELNYKISATESQLDAQRSDFNSKIEENRDIIDSIRQQQETSLGESITKLEGKIQDLNSSLSSTIQEADRNASDFRKNLTMLTSSITQLGVSINGVIANTTALDRRVDRYHSLPLNCTSLVYEYVAENSPETSSPPININQVSTCSSYIRTKKRAFSLHRNDNN